MSNSHVWVLLDLAAKEPAEAIKDICSSKGKARETRDDAGEAGAKWVIWCWTVNGNRVEEGL
jgi:hypothetical protein